jgi:SAM-dependent methyltransferase
MHIVQRGATFMRGLLKRYGPSRIKMMLWDREFSGGHWDFIDNTVGDCVYSHLERYAVNGNILDLGCGPGNTSSELTATAYQNYVGVDISEAALSKAKTRTKALGRTDKNRFVCADFISYIPTQQFDVILFRESMYHVPFVKVRATLEHYSKYLKTGGVFIVRMNTLGTRGHVKSRLAATMAVMQTEFDVVEQTQYGEKGPTVIVFRPTPPSADRLRRDLETRHPQSVGER